MAEALSRAPSVWLCDEIDSMPKKNGEDIRYREWYVAVVNGLLEISERGARPGVIILGAANTISRMDPALMRAGRFGDRIIEIPRPDEAALCGILRHHLAGDLAAADLLRFARSSLGATGADVAAWVRGARRLARNEGRSMRPDDLMKQIVPADDRSADDIRCAAYHEAGHCVAMVAVLRLRVDFVSIVRKDGSGGQTSPATFGTDFPTRDDFEKNILMLLSGRAAEEIFIGSPSAASSGGPSSDLARATDIVAGIHTAWGMGRAPVVHAHFREASALLRADAKLRRTVEDHIARIYGRALKIVRDNAHAIKLLAEQLMLARHLDGNEIDRILRSAGLELNRPKPARTVVSGSMVPDLAGSPDMSAAPRTDSNRSAMSKKPNRGRRQLGGFDP
jgi:ATP-dependent Zn protease